MTPLRQLLLLIVSLFAAQSLAKCAPFDSGSFDWAVQAYKAPDCDRLILSRGGNGSLPCNKIATSATGVASISWLNGEMCRVELYFDRCNGKGRKSHLTSKNDGAGWHTDPNLYAYGQEGTRGPTHWRVRCT
jgi:hypothetical protein